MVISGVSSGLFRDASPLSAALPCEAAAGSRISKTGGSGVLDVEANDAVRREAFDPDYRLVATFGCRSRGVLCKM